MQLVAVNSISRKFLVPTLALTAVVLAGLGFFIIAGNNASIRSMMDSRGNALADFMNKMSVSYYSNFDFLAIEDLVKEITKDPEVAFAVFYDVQKKPLTRNSIEPADISQLIVYERTITADNGMQLGSLRLGYNRTKLAENLRKSFLIVAAGIVIAMLLFFLGITYLVNRVIINRMKQTMEMITCVAGGDLTRSVPITSSDEIGMLGRGLNTMIEGLKTMLGSARDSAGKLEAVSDRVAGASSTITAGSQEQHAAVEDAASSVNEMHSALKEIGGSVADLNTTVERTSSAVIETSASSDEVARTMTDLSSLVEETSAALSQMTAAIREIAESVESLSSAAEGTASSVGQINASVKEVEASAQQSAKLAEAVTGDAQELGMQSIAKAIDGMRLISEETLRTAEVINRLGGRAESIGSILTVIGGITDKTTLLALNASILAAQAGEHGKGFAVVAGEIRELANRTASSTQEISGLIKSVQAEAREAVAVMQKGVALVEDGTRLTNDAGSALRKILERAGQSRDMSGIISKAAMEQAAGMKQVSEAVERVNAMAHQIARATGEQRTGSDQIIRASERMREITRFVRNATTEQVKAGKDIVAAVETISVKIGQVHRASTEVRTGSELIVKAIERIRTIAKDNAFQADQLGDSVQVMTAQAASLKSDIDRFRV